MFRAAFFLGAVSIAAASDACELEAKISIGSCTAAKFGCNSNGTMWVSGGCRGTFTCGAVKHVKCDPCDPAKECKIQGGKHTCKCVEGPAPPAPSPGVKYMLLDDRNIIEGGTAEFVLGKVEKVKGGAGMGSMIHDGDPARPYEMRFDNMQPNVWYDPIPYPGRKKWRAWYSAFTSCSKPLHTVPFCNNQPQTCGTVNPTGGGRTSGLLYAESDDGFNWTKPDLNMAEFPAKSGNTKNNLLENDGMTTGIYLDETAPAAARYKISTGSNGKGGIAVSPDGITGWVNATKDLEEDTHARWDTPKNIVWDPLRKQWIMYLRAQPTEGSTAGALRIQSYSHSNTADFMGDWSPATPTGLNTSTDYQPDGLVVFPYEGIYLGIGNVFNTAKKTAASGAVVGQVNMVLGWSADGRRWKWLKPNDSIIPLGAVGEFDTCGVFGAKQDPLRTMVNDTLRYYYAGCNGPFFGSRGCGLGMVTLPRDGFAGYQGGSVFTAPVRVAGDSLKVSVDGGATGIKVGVVGDKEMTVENCDPIVGSVVDHEVTWKGQALGPKWARGALSLEFDIPEDATAFAYSL